MNIIQNAAETISSSNKALKGLQEAHQNKNNAANINRFRSFWLGILYILSVK